MITAARGIISSLSWRRNRGLLASSSVLSGAVGSGSAHPVAAAAAIGEESQPAWIFTHVIDEIKRDQHSKGIHKIESRIIQSRVTPQLYDIQRQGNISVVVVVVVVVSFICFFSDSHSQYRSPFSTFIHK